MKTLTSLSVDDHGKSRAYVTLYQPNLSNEEGIGKIRTGKQAAGLYRKGVGLRGKGGVRKRVGKYKLAYLLYKLRI